MAVVEVRNGYKFYGSKSKPEIVLNNLNMSVQPGTIYGLLGASGCGKTTMLSCMVGQCQLNGGKVCVLGQKPGGPGSGIPGSRIGYMPQQIALSSQMSVKESIYYFGRIYGMTNEQIYIKFKSLQKLLQLPPSSQLIEKCSGGQQRRVSFACAVIHDPELLILDMPTVGLDPMATEKIWEFMVATTRQSKTTVIFTTHYIEEAKHAHCIGLMRNGILLAEDTPDNVMLRLEVNSIEDAFIILSQRQGASDVIERDLSQMPSQVQPKMQAVGGQVIDTSQATIQSEEISTSVTKSSKNSKSRLSNKKDPIKALLVKNFIKMSRNPVMACFVFLWPLLSLSSFYMAIGRPIKDINLGIFSTESNCEHLNMTTVSIVDDICYLNNISCRFIRALGTTDFIKTVLYHDLEDAYRDAKKTYIAGYIHIPGNFSTAIQTRLEAGRLADDYTIEQSIVTSRLDTGGVEMSYFAELKVRELFQNFIQNILTECGLAKNMLSAPIYFNKPIYGSKETDFQRSMIPGFILSMVFLANTLVTTNIFIEERSDGVWDRTLVAGVSATQMLWSHLFTQFIMMIIQNAYVVLFAMLAFSSHNQGNVAALGVLLYLVSVCGILHGIVMSVYCKSHMSCGYISTVLFYGYTIMCGFMWPLEAMPTFLKNIILITPLPLPIISAINIFERDWEITNMEVYKGYLVIAAWIGILYILCLVGLKRKM